MWARERENEVHEKKPYGKRSRDHKTEQGRETERCFLSENEK